MTNQKPVSVGQLQLYANVAARLLFLLRDGREGRIWKVTDSTLFEMKIKGPVSQRCSRSEIIDKMRKLKAPGWAIESPVFPSPDLWEALKQARTEREIMATAAKIAQWDREQQLGYTPDPRGSQVEEYDFIRVLAIHAHTIIAALQLPEYPKSRRPKSDDKRVWFFAKVLAGLMCEQRPLYTLKRLSRWHGDGIFAETKRHVAPKVV